MDAEDAEYGTVMAKAFARFQKMGLKTAVDVVSENSDRFARLVIPALKYVDYLILNEFEAGQTVGIELRDPSGALRGQRLRETAEKLLQAGNSELVVIHMPEGGYALARWEKRSKFHPTRSRKKRFKARLEPVTPFVRGTLWVRKTCFPDRSLAIGFDACGL
jgi:sugar/nucleoside kinase (ribokinase family)